MLPCSADGVLKRRALQGFQLPPRAYLHAPHPPQGNPANFAYLLPCISTRGLVLLCRQPGAPAPCCKTPAPLSKASQYKRQIPD